MPDEPDDPEEHGGTDDGDEGNAHAHLRKDEEVDEPDDAEAEEEGVGLEIADLRKAQDETGAPRRAAQAADEQADRKSVV